MIKYGFIITACCLCAACRQPANKVAVTDLQGRAVNGPVAKTISADSLISPGKGIGNIHLGEDANKLTNILGQPDRSDAAMGASLMLWFAAHNASGYQTSVYAHRNMGMKDEHISHIKQIRITSPAYKTVDGIGTGSPFNSINKHFKVVKRKVSGTDIYDDVKAGIAFEMDVADKCSAIIVRAAMDSSATYINMRE